MLAQEKGVCSGSDLYFNTPSDNAKRMLFYMVSCGYYYTNYDYQVDRAGFNSYLLFYIMEGRLSVTSNGQTLVAGKGQVGLVDCHIPHEYHTIGNTEFIWIHLDGSNSKDFFEQIMAKYGSFIFNPSVAEAIQQQIFEMVYEYRNALPHLEIHESVKIYQLLATLLSDLTKGTAQEQKPIEIAHDYIRRHYAENITLTEIAAIVNMSQFHFSRQFKKLFGYSPHEFLILTRINMAKQLLKTTNKTIKEISLSVGYQNINAFEYAFTSRVGVPPTTFRRYPI